MKYFIMKQDPRFSNNAYTADTGGLDMFELADGLKMEDPGELHINLTPNSGNHRGCIIEGATTLFHKNFITELNKLGVDNIQYFPVHMHAPDGMIEKAYSVANIIGLVDAVDVENSKLGEKIGNIRQTLYSFTIDPEKTEGLHIFRILHAPSLIIIDEWLYNKLHDYNPPAVLMYPIEEYNGWS